MPTGAAVARGAGSELSVDSDAPPVLVLVLVLVVVDSFRVPVLVPVTLVVEVSTVAVLLTSVASAIVVVMPEAEITPVDVMMLEPDEITVVNVEARPGMTMLVGSEDESETVLVSVGMSFWPLEVMATP